MTILYSPAVWAAVAFLVAVGFLQFERICRLLAPSGLKGIAVFPNSSPITGDVPRLAHWIKDKHQVSSFFDDAAAQLGDVCHIRTGPRMGGLVVVSDYQEMEDILLRRTQEFDRSKDTIDVFSAVMSTAQICLRTNDMWKHHRRLIGPSMTSKYLSLTTPRANHAVANLIALWKTKGVRLGKGDDAPGRCFEAQQDLEWATLDAICDIALGQSWRCLETAIEQISATSPDPAAHTPTEEGEVVFKVTPPELFTAVSYIFNSFPTLSPTPLIQHFFSRLRPAYQKHHKALFSFLTRRFAESRMQAQGRGEEAAELADSTLDLITARENKGSEFLSDKEMRDELFQFLVAGAETTAVTLSWWVKYMAANPDIQRKLRNYLRTEMPELDDRPPTYAEVATDRLPYLEAVTAETLRLSRTAGAVTREATVDATILGKFIPKGTVLLLTTSRIATIDESTPIVSLLNPEVSRPAPEIAAELDPLRSKSSRAAGRKAGWWAAGTGFKFDPNRWLERDGSFNPNAGPMLPFSSGQRGCFGKNLGNLELKLFIAQLTLAFFFEPVPKELDSYEGIEVVARHPEHSFVRPVPWSRAQ